MLAADELFGALHRGTSRTINGNCLEGWARPSSRDERCLRANLFQMTSDSSCGKETWVVASSAEAERN